MPADIVYQYRLPEVDKINNQGCLYAIAKNLNVNISIKGEFVDKNAFFWQIQEGHLPQPAAAITLGINFLRADPEAGVFEAEFEGKKEFTNPVGNIQGGFLSAMLDETMGPALATRLAEGEFAPTLNLNVQFFSPAKVGRLHGVGRVEQHGGSICYLSGKLFQDGRIVATATATAVIRKFQA